MSCNYVRPHLTHMCTLWDTKWHWASFVNNLDTFFGQNALFLSFSSLSSCFAVCGIECSTWFSVYVMPSFCVYAYDFCFFSLSFNPHTFSIFFYRSKSSSFSLFWILGHQTWSSSVVFVLLLSAVGAFAIFSLSTSHILWIG